MGCFYHSCGVTRNTIFADEEVYFVLIANAYEGALTAACYVNDHFTPVSFPIRCTYDEYGRFFPVPEHEDLAELIMKHIRKNVIIDIEDRSGRNRDHDITEDLTWEEMMDCIHDGRVKLRNPHMRDGNGSTLSNFAIKKSVYEEMMGWKFNHWRGELSREALSVKIDEDIVKQLADEEMYTEEEQAKYDSILAAMMKNDSDELTEEDMKKAAHEYVIDMRRFSDFGERGPFEDSGVDRYGASLNVTEYYRSFKRRIKKNGKLSETDEKLVEAFKDVRQLGVAMDTLHIQWIPPMFAGQDDNVDEQIRYHEAVLNSLKKDKHRWCHWDETMSQEDQEKYGSCEHCKGHG